MTSELDALRRSVALITTVAEHAPARLRAALLDAIDELRIHVDALPGRDETLAHDNERLRAQVAAKDVLLGAVAHELRGPLSAVLGFALTLERGTMVSEEERAVIIARLADRARAMSQTVDDLLDLDLFARGALTLRPERANLGAIVHDALALARIDEREIHVEPSDVTATLDRPRAVRMVRALVEAAAALTPTSLSLTFEEHNGSVAIIVTSEPSEAVDRVSPERARLSLALASTLAEIHAGRVAVSPREGGTVWLRLEIPRSP